MAAGPENVPTGVEGVGTGVGVGLAVGEAEGLALGAAEGLAEGAAVGLAVELSVGAGARLALGSGAGVGAVDAVTGVSVGAAVAGPGENGALVSPAGGVADAKTARCADVFKTVSGGAETRAVG